MKRSMTVWLLALFFAWAAVKSARSLAGAESVTDYALLNSVGIGVVFYVITALLLIGEGLTAFLLLAKRASAYRVGRFLIVGECVNGLVISGIAALHPDVARSMYAASRTARGIPGGSDSLLDFLFSPLGTGAVAVVYMTGWAVLYYLLRRVRPELERT